MAAHLRYAAALVAAGLALVSAPAALAAFPGGNGLVAFESYAPGITEQVFLMNGDGTNVRQLTFDGRNRDANWSADGDQIVFSSTRAGGFDIWVMAGDGSRQRPVTNDDVIDIAPAFTADGAQVVYQGHSNQSDIYAVDVDGTNRVNLTSHPVDDIHPATAPHGGRIAFASARGATTYHVFTMRSDGSDVRQLTFGSAHDYWPDWSPNGNDIVFTREVGGNWDLYVVHANGRGLARLTDTPDRDEATPTWSPDGDRIVFTACADLTSALGCGLYAIARGGAGETQLRSGGNLNASWQPLGQRRVWDAALDFRLAPDQANPSADVFGNAGVWSYLWSDGLVHDPSQYRPFRNYTVVDGWRQQWDDPAFVNLIVGRLGDNRMLLHSWGGRAIAFGRSAIVAWTSPIGGRVTVTAEVALPDLASCPFGDGILWSVDRGSTSLAAAAIPAGGGTMLSVETTVSVGETLYFVHDPGFNGNCDSALARLRVTKP